MDVEHADAQRSENQRTTRSPMRRLFSGLPSLLVLCALGAVGAWGHHTDWKAPRLRDLFGRTAPEDAEDWCTAHGVPDSKCIACHPELIGESSVDWCKEHGVPESRCTICHPEILATGVVGDWCAEHDLPESACTICHPEIAHVHAGTPEEPLVTVTAGSHAGERAEDHPAGDDARATKGLRDPHTCQKHALKVQFASVASMTKAGVHVGSAVERPMTDSIVVNAEVAYERTRFAEISARAMGTAWRVDREQGGAVRAGDVLALIDCADVGRAKAQYLQALAALDASRANAARMKASSEAGFRTESERLQADTNSREAEIRLFDARQALANFGFVVPPDALTNEAVMSLGLPESVRSSLIAGTAPVSLIPLVAPFDGLIVSSRLVAGEVVEPGKVLFEIADTRRMWLAMDVPQAQAHRIALGHEVIFRPDDARDEVATGEVTWISTAVDERTRTVKVRAVLPNLDAALRANSFGRAQIVVRTSPTATAVSSDAVQWEGCCYVVFVRIADEIFQTRKVRLGAKDAAYTEIVAGLLPGEVVATVGSHVLKSEILKSSLGAGCTDD